ncbi:MAG: sterol desaturase family protein [Myxococcales bacterium]|nr:sterol desaturase family protein [Myxococcales bacterium]
MASIPERLSIVSGALTALFFVFIPFELRARHKRGTLTRDSVREMFASASPLIPTLLLGAVTVSFVTGLFLAASRLAITRVPTTALTTVTCLLLCDLLYYVDHRAGHRLRVYWAVSHSVHHSSPQYDQSTALRVSFVDGFLSPWFQVPAVLVGFDPLLVAGCFGVVIAYQQWIHTETIGSLGWLDRVFMTPSNHRVHHSSQPEHLDKNYGGILVIWDRMFGTYARETGAVTYGLTRPIESINPIEVHVAELRRLVADLRRPATLLDKCKLLFLGPEFVPQSWTDAHARRALTKAASESDATSEAAARTT